MKNFYIGNCVLSTRKEKLEKFLNYTYMKHYKKERLKHITRNDKRLPHIKVTDDIFSCAVFIKDRSNRELRIFLDGTVTIEGLFISTLTTDGMEFSAGETDAFVGFLKELSEVCQGYLLFSINYKPFRAKEGVLSNYQTLLAEVFNCDSEKEGELLSVYEMLQEYKNEGG